MEWLVCKKKYILFYKILHNLVDILLPDYISPSAYATIAN